MFDTLSRTARFLPELPARTVLGRLTRVEPASRDLVEVPLGRIAILANQEQLAGRRRRVAQKGNDRARPRMRIISSSPTTRSGKANRVEVEVDHSPGIHSARGNAWGCHSRDSS